MPSFVARVERPDRGGEWVAYLERRARPARAGPRGWGSTAPTPSDGRPSVRLLHVDGDEDALLAALLFEAAGDRRGAHARPPRRARRRASARELLADLVGERANRRHRPGRGFEALRYRFEIVSDYGAFRDLQRHRMLTVPVAGADAGPRRRRARGGRRGRRRRRLRARAGALARPSTSGSSRAGLRDAAPYALCLGYRIRYVLDLNAREAMQLIELRSGREGHPSYRAVAHEMHARSPRSTPPSPPR